MYKMDAMQAARLAEKFLDKNIESTPQFTPAEQAIAFFDEMYDYLTGEKKQDGQ